MGLLAAELGQGIGKVDRGSEGPRIPCDRYNSKGCSGQMAHCLPMHAADGSRHMQGSDVSGCGLQSTVSMFKANVGQKPGVLVMSYNTFRLQKELIYECNVDIVVCDEVRRFRCTACLALRLPQ